MQLNAREVAFVKSVMKKVEVDDTSQPTERKEAARIRQKAESSLTE
jgi:hypothetical protein